MGRRITLAGLALVVAAAGLMADDAQTGESSLKRIGGLAFVDEIELTVVNVLAHVTDTSGTPVIDLAASDFRLYQDGEEKPITNFDLFTEEVIRSYYDATAARPGPLAPTPAAAADLPEPQPVHLVFYVDNENLRPLDRNRVLRQMRSFVMDNLHPPVRAMVVSYQRSFRVLQEFTSDPDEVLAALRSVATYTGARTTRDSDRRAIVDAMSRAQDQERTRSGYDPTQMGQYNTVYRLVQAFADEETNDLAFTLDSLRGVVTSLAGLPGKKAVIYISNGLPLVPGIDLFYELSRVYRDTSILTQLSTYDRSSAFQSLVAAANAQNVTFYTIGAGGLEVPGMGAAEHAVAQDPLSASIGSNNYIDTLRLMADGTGGLAIVNTNDITDSLKRVKNDLYTYYSLGYPLTTSGGDKVHRIEVTVPGRPGLTVRHRGRFVEKSTETRVQDKVIAGLSYELEDNPMLIELEAGVPAPAAEDRWTAPMHLSFPLEKIALVPEGDDYVGRLVLFVAARDSKGKQSDLVRQEHEVRIPAADYEAARSKRFGIDLALLMETGRYKVVAGLLDRITNQPAFAAVTTTVGSPKD